MQLTGNTILITGGTSGIGRGLAEAFHHLGNKVIIAGRRRNLIDEITAANPGMHGLQLDIADPAAIDAFAIELQREFPDLNVLINNAGISRREDLTTDDPDVSISRSMVETNIVGPLHLTAALLPTLKAQATSTIMMTTSGLAFVPFAPFPTYCATKAFLHSWLQSLRFQLRHTSVKVLELAPPYVQTELAGPQQLTDPHAVPLADFVAEVIALLGDPNPYRDEILVERVKELRWAEKGDDYQRIFATNNNR